MSLNTHELPCVNTFDTNICSFPWHERKNHPWQFLSLIFDDSEVAVHSGATMHLNHTPRQICPALVLVNREASVLVPTALMLVLSSVNKSPLTPHTLVLHAETLHTNE